MKQLKRVVLGEETYNYIKYSDGSTSVDGLKFNVSKGAREHFINLGGFMRDMFSPIEDKNVYEVVVLFVEIPVRGQLTAIQFNNSIEGKSIYRMTSAGRFIDVLKSNVKEANIEYETINTLEEIYNNPEYELNIFLNQYINRKNVNDTGLYINDVVVNHGDKLTTTSKTTAENVMSQIIDGSEDNSIYRNIKLSKIDFTVNELNPFGLDVELKLYDNNDKAYTYLHKEVAKELGRMPDEKEYDEYIQNDKIYTLYEYAVDLNDKLNRRGGITADKRNEMINRMIRSYEYEVNLNDDNELAIYVSYSFLNKLMKDNLLKFK